MGVDFYPCAVCGRILPDCGRYMRCGNCKAVFCSDECGQLRCSAVKFGCEYDDGRGDYDGCDHCSCVLCRKEKATDSALLSFMLERGGMTRAQAVEIYRKEPAKGKRT